MRTYREITADRQAAEDRKSAIGEETRAITTRLNEEGRTADAGEQERLARLERGYQKAETELASLGDETRELLRVTAQNPNLVEGPYQPQERSGETRDVRPERDAAHRAIDRAEKSRELPADAAERAERLLSVGTAQEQGIAARWVATTGDPVYARAFGRLLADPTRGHLLWTPQEADAFRKVEETRAYMGLTDNVGGFMVPMSLDPAIILSSAGTNNIMRKVATVKQTVSESWNGVTSAGVSAEWLAENSQAAEATPTLAAVPIPVLKAAAFTPFSYEVGMDAVNFGAELAKVLVDAADTLCATAYTTGPGTTAPTGIVTALVGGASEINGLGSEVLAASDPYALQNVLPGRFSAGAAFMSHIAIANAYGQMETAAGARTFPELRDGRLLNKPWHENPHMDGVINAAATENNYVLVYGDFSQYFIIDRIGTTIEIIPNLMGANYRPTGSRGAFLWLRTGGNVSTINAFRMLDIPTTA
jgi:HK97 family phage major capsid protein